MTDTIITILTISEMSLGRKSGLGKDGVGIFIDGANNGHFFA